MNIIDISWPIRPTMTTYKDKKDVTFIATKTFERDHARESRLAVGCHTGTHIDAPAHFLPDGAPIQAMTLSSTVGPCKVLDMTYVKGSLEAEVFQQHDIDGGDIIICKTANSFLSADDPFNVSFVFVAASGARYLADKKIKAIGIDYLGIERNQPDHATHEIFMRADIAIIEGLRLEHVLPGKYFLWCLPLALHGLEAAPARAILTNLP